MGREVKSEYYYYCTNSKRQHEKKPIGTNDAKLTEQIAEVFKQMKVPQEDLEKITKTLRESHEGKVKFTEEETRKCRQEIDRYQKMIENAYEDKCAGSITHEQYDKFQTKWRDLQDKAQSRLGRIMKADKEYYITASYLLELASRSYDLFLGSESEQKRQLLGLVFENLSVKDGNLYYIMVKPFDSIFKSASSHKWGQLLDSFLNVSIDFKFNINNIHALLNSNNFLAFSVKSV